MEVSRFYAPCIALNEHLPYLSLASRIFAQSTSGSRTRIQNFKVKVDPLVVYTFKSFNSRLQGSVLGALKGLRTEASAALPMIHSLSSTIDAELGDFRMEVAIKASTLMEVRDLVRQTTLTCPLYWLGTGEGILPDIDFLQRPSQRKVFLPPPTGSIATGQRC